MTDLEAMAEVQRALSDELARLGARCDQLNAARRDWLTPVANIPIPNDPKESEGNSHGQ